MSSLVAETLDLAVGAKGHCLLAAALLFLAWLMRAIRHHVSWRTAGEACHIGATLRVLIAGHWTRLRGIPGRDGSASDLDLHRHWFGPAGESALRKDFLQAHTGILNVLQWAGIAAWIGAGIACYSASDSHDWIPPLLLLVGMFSSLQLLLLGCGGWVFHSEERRRRRMPAWGRSHTISVVMPVLNEAHSLPDTLRSVYNAGEVMELIVVDGGSSDQTVEVARGLGCRVLGTPAGRGIQLRQGALEARGDLILFLHADTWLSPRSIRAMRASLRDPTVVGGGFWKRFRDPPVLLLGSRPKCLLRVWVGRRIVGDMAMFARREALELVGGVPAIELMEDIELSKRLRRLGRLALAGSTVSTSARRFREHGVLRTYLRMWQVTWMHRLGVAPKRLMSKYR